MVPYFRKKPNRSVAFSIPRIASATHLTILNLCAKRHTRKMVASNSPHITTFQPFEESASRRPSHASWANNYPWPPWTRWLRHSRNQVLKIIASWMDWTLYKLNCNSEDAFGAEFATRRTTTLKGRRWRLSSWLRASIEPPHPNAKVWPLPKQTSKANFQSKSNLKRINQTENVYRVHRVYQAHPSGTAALQPAILRAVPLSWASFQLRS